MSATSGGEVQDRIAICGDDLVSIDVRTPAEAQALAGELRASGDWLEVVGGMQSVVVQFDAAAIDTVTALAMLTQVAAAPSSLQPGNTPSVTLPVIYDGPDLDAVCERLSLSRAEFIEQHAGGEYVVDMLGFTPGFAYIGGLDAAVPGAAAIPRLASPRQRVAAGSIGVAAGKVGVYALAGPGGWPIVGHTPLVLFDPAASPPFLLSAGARVCFEPVGTGSSQ